MSNAINFLDFMQLLEMISIKVYTISRAKRTWLCLIKSGYRCQIYPRDPGHVAAKRLILENVLLLSNRRTPTMDQFDLDNPEATKLITETFSTGLQHIFNYYTAKAHVRRNNAVSAEKMKQKAILRQAGILETDKEAVAQVISPVKRQNLSYLKSLMVSQRETISYKEYLAVRYGGALYTAGLLSFLVVVYTRL